MARSGMQAVVWHTRLGLGAAVLSVILAGCGSGGAAPDDDAGAAADGPAASAPNDESATGASEDAPDDGDGGVAGEGLCALFTADEMANVLDRPAQAGEVGGPMDTLCQWVAVDEEADVTIQLVDDTSYWDPPTGEDGYVAIDIGDEAYLTPWMGGRTAAAREGSSLYYVNLAPAPDDDEVLVDLLIEFMARSSG